MEFDVKRFRYDRSRAVREAIEKGIDKDWVAQELYNQQKNEVATDKMNRQQCKEFVYKIAYDVYMKNLKAAGCVRSN